MAATSAGSEKPSAGWRARKAAHTLARSARRATRCSALEIFMPSSLASSSPPSPAPPCTPSPPLAASPPTAPPPAAPPRESSGRAAPSSAVPPRADVSASMIACTALMASTCQSASFGVRIDRTVCPLAKPRSVTSSTSSVSTKRDWSLATATAPASDAHAISSRAVASLPSVSSVMRSRSPGSTRSISRANRSPGFAASLRASRALNRRRRSTTRSRTVILARLAAAARASDSAFCFSSSRE
mmetsp:Transcript_1884/g.6204  ORF Transcript_1884/g.6204 Transcript_1884/m.6204 type:complete len:243 (-) Transcript_1884:2328-3056(-)